MKTYLRRMLVGLTAIAAGLVAVLPASTATAATTKPNLVVPADVHTVYQRFYGYPTQANPGVSVTGVAACPSGTRLVGMGAGNGTVGALSPVQNFTAVRMTGVVTWPSPTYGGNFIQVELLCAPAGQFTDVKTVQVVDHRARNQRGHYLRDVAKCPGGYYAFGGGGYFSNNTGAAESGFESAYWIIGNGPTPDGTGWAFTGQAPYDAESMVVVTQCAPRVGQTLLNLTGTSTVPNPNPNDRKYESRAAYAHCPSGYTPISGGWYIATPLEEQAYPIDAQNYIGTNVWSVGGPQTNDSSTGQLSWYANATVMAGDKLEVLVQCIRP